MDQEKCHGKKEWFSFMLTVSVISPLPSSVMFDCDSSDFVTLSKNDMSWYQYTLGVYMLPLSQPLFLLLTI